MISPYHEPVAEHYERYPYPRYPWFALGRWNSLQSVDLARWEIALPVRDLWIAGAGTIAPLMFARRNPDVRILATDLSEKSLEILRKRLFLMGAHNVWLRREDLMEARYQKSFDAIDCFGVLHHTVSPERCLERLVTALRPGGVLRLMVYSDESRSEIDSLRREMKERKLDSLPMIKDYLKIRLTPEDIRGDLRSDVGLADAFLNPIVQTYTLETFNRLLHAQGDLELVRLETTQNFVAYLRRR